MQTETEKLYERVAWLERKMVRVLYFNIALASMFAGFVVTYNIDSSFGWISILAGVGVWLILSLILQRQEFKGAPKHIDYIDP